MSGFESVTVDMLRKALVNSGVLTEDQANDIKGKKGLTTIALQANMTPEQIPVLCMGERKENIPVLMASMNPDIYNEPIANEQEKVEQAFGRPETTSTGWHDYVMEQFDTDSELVNGAPNINGLRRVTTLLFGELAFSGAVDFRVTHGQGMNDPGRATCLYEVRLNTGEIYRGIGGSYVGNTSDDYSVYPEAIAETRAEARALRKLLGLRTAAAEEISDKDPATIVSSYIQENTQVGGEWGDDQKISSNQITFINTKCKVFGIDPEKFINKKFYTGQATEKQFARIEDIPRVTAALMVQELSKYQTCVDGESKDIPKEILCL